MRAGGFMTGRGISTWRLWRGLLVKDLRLLWGGTSTVVMVMLFGLLMLSILGFSLELRDDTTREVSASLLWIVFWFTGEVLMQQSFQHERAGGAYYPVLAALRRPGLFFWSKVVTNLAATAVIHFLIVILYTVMFGIAWQGRWSMFALIWGSAMPAYVIVGTLISCLTLTLRHRALLYPILLFPVMMGVFMLAARATLYTMQNYARMFILQPLQWLWISLIINAALAFWVAPLILQPGVAFFSPKETPNEPAHDFQD